MFKFRSLSIKEPLEYVGQVRNMIQLALDAGQRVDGGYKSGSKETILEARDDSDMDQKLAFSSFLFVPSMQHKLSQSRSLVNICRGEKYLTTDEADPFVRAARGRAHPRRR